jgi:hypothetical protein
MTPEFVARVHSCWVIFGIVGWPFIAAVVRPQQILAACLVQSLTFMIWGIVGAERLCPLRELEYALRNGEPINHWWITQPILTVIGSVVFCELFWMTVNEG